jgi:3-oxoacyl-[acyl-carrier protein] reductase
MDLGLKGKRALVTASSKGLGKASALALAEEGARVLICARGADELAKAAAEIEAVGAEVVALPEDVTEPGAPQRLVDATVEAFGGIDILVGNAGGPPPGFALDVSDEQIEAAVNANLTTSVRLVRAAVPHMKEAGWGRICLITSSSIKQPIPSLSLSNTARAGLWAWSKTAAADLFEDSITLNLACPGLHATDRIKNLGMGEGEPIGDPADFGKVVAFLCSEATGFVSGTAVLVDGARSVGLL